MNSQEQAVTLDKTDPLREFRNDFIIPVIEGKPQIYFLGNSLGLQPKSTATHIQKVLDGWANHGVESFFVGDEPWLNYHDTLTGPMAEIVGALPSEIVIMNQLTVNLHLMMVSFYRPQGKKRKIICEAKAFPSDQYMFESYLKHYGFNPEEILIEVEPEPGEQTIRIENVLAAIENNKEELALVLWGGLNYYTGQVFDMELITKTAHKAGALVGFDLAHAAGNIPLKLHDWQVDFACWCTYKYLNAGPGAVGAVFVHEKYHREESINRFAGWWGYEKERRFAMQKGFKPIHSAEGWQLSTPSILLYASLKASLEIFEKAGMERLHSKRQKLNEYLWSVLEEVKASFSGNLFELITPREEAQKGCQVSMLMLKDGKRIYDGLINEGIIVDWREPNVIRFAPVPLYNRYEEIWLLGNCLKKLLQEKHL